MFALDDLVTPVTKEQVQASIYDVLGIVGTSITSWKPFSPVRTMITGVSILGAGFSQLLALIARSGFRTLSSGDWLKLVAVYVYGIEEDVFAATFATGELTLTNTGGGVFSLDPGDVVAINEASGKTYRNTAAVSLGVGETLTIAIQATEAGAASTSAPNTITALETTLLGVTVTNAQAVVGRDEMSDAEVNSLCSEKLGSLSPFGPVDAFSYAARTAERSDGTRVGVTRVRTVRDGFGNVVTYVATATGAVTGDADDPGTDLGAVNEAIQLRAAPLGFTATVESAEEVAIPVTYQAWMYNTSGHTPAQTEVLIASKLAAFIATQPIGGNVVGVDPGKVFANAIRTAIGSTLAEIFSAVVTAPAADVELAINEVAVLGTVTATAITQVPQGEGI